MAGALLRSGALADARVAAVVNDRFVPVWVDTRESPYPAVPALDEPARDLGLGDDRRIVDTVTYYFHARTFLVSADGRRLLNREEALESLTVVRAGPYLEMLERALARHGAASGPAGESR